MNPLPFDRRAPRGLRDPGDRRDSAGPGAGDGPGRVRLARRLEAQPARRRRAGAIERLALGAIRESRTATPALSPTAPPVTPVPTATITYGDGTWALLPPMPGPLWGAAAAVLEDGRVVVVGGSAGPSSNSALATVEVFDPAVEHLGCSRPDASGARLPGGCDPGGRIGPRRRRVAQRSAARQRRALLPRHRHVGLSRHDERAEDAGHGHRPARRPGPGCRRRLAGIARLRVHQYGRDLRPGDRDLDADRPDVHGTCLRHGHAPVRRRGPGDRRREHLPRAQRQGHGHGRNLRP